MDNDIRHLIQTIHDTDGKTVVVAAGAGTQALAWLLGVAGASRTLLDARIPYGRNAFRQYLGYKPPKHVTREAARLLAGNALTRARKVREDPDERVVGLSCTATIVTDRPKRGEHRAHIATWTNERVVCYTIYLTKGARDRDGEEEVVSRIMLNALAAAFKLDEQVGVPLLEGEKVEIQTYDFVAAVRRLLEGEVKFLGINDHGLIRYEGINPQVLMPGSFNPLHVGHLGLMQTATEMTEKPVAFEISAYNVDKPPLPEEVILDRMAQFAGRQPVYVTNAPTFLEKARLFPRTTFVVGYDTAVRILAPRYYNNSYNEMLAALDELRERGCRFLVAGRANDEGEYFQADDLEVPSGYETLFTPIPSHKFRRDISSTEIRSQRQK